MSNGRIVVGTSSWADPGFVEEWYPPELPARDRLAWYAERFEAVEVNSSFYALPQKGAVARWARVTPDDFRAHGRNAEGYLKGKTVAERFGYRYSEDEVQELADRVRGLADLAMGVRTMLNNNRGADAPTSARRMKELLGQDPGPPQGRLG